MYVCKNITTHINVYKKIQLYVYTNINTHINVCIHNYNHSYKYLYNCIFTCFFTTEMFKLNEIYEVHRRILKFDIIRYSPAQTSAVNTAISQLYINIPRQDFVTSLLNSYLELNFEVTKRADISRYSNGDDIRLVSLGAIALFTFFKLTTSSGKHLEDISHSHIVSLMHKLITNAKDSDDVSFGFDRSRDRRRQELFNNKNVGGNFHVRNMLKDVFLVLLITKKKLHMALVKK